MVRFSAAEAIAAYGSAARSAVPALTRLLDDPSPAPRAAAAKTFRRIYPNTIPLFPQLGDE